MNVGDRVRVKKCRMGKVESFRTDGFAGVRLDLMPDQLVWFHTDNLTVINETMEELPKEFPDLESHV